MPNDDRLLLIIEDDEVLLRALYLTFHKAGFKIASTVDGESGLKMAQRLEPDIILLDLLLPKMSGFDVLKYIKANPKLKSIPVVVLSNIADTADIEKVKALGVEDYFVKSNVRLDDLIKKVKAILIKKI